MNERRILYETSLAKTGVALGWAAVAVVLLFVSFGLFLAFGARSFQFKLSVLAWLCVCIFRGQIRWLLRLPFRRHSGVYQISIDNYGLYVHCDAPKLAPSFSVVATDISRLIRKTIRDSEGDEEHEYYVETKSGRRHRIQNLLMCWPHLDVMDLFDQITDYFRTLEIAEEKVEKY